MDEELLEILNNQEWDKILIELMAYAVWLCQVRYHKSVPESIEAEELVMASVDKVYGGDRKWNPETDRDLIKYLKSVIKSHLSNQIRSSYHLDNYDKTDHDISKTLWHNPEEELYYQQLDEKIIKSMAGDGDVCLVYKGLKDGLKPQDIAKEYGVEIQLVRNAQRRLRTIILRILPSSRRNKLQTNEFL
jgi:DNA-directed RNA polymerase specialized sigma24 family protein